MSKKLNLPPSPLSSVPDPMTPKEQLEMRIALLHDQYVADPSHVLAAFEALEAVVAPAWERDEDAKNMISLPLWVADALAGGYKLYRDTDYAGRNRTRM